MRSTQTVQALGIDVGGSGIKGAPVDVQTGQLLAERFRLPTPESGKPKAMAKVVAEIVQHFDWKGLAGMGFPSALQNGVALTAANIHAKWIGVNAETLFSETSGCPFRVINDADAAGLAEMRFGAGRDCLGTVLVVTIGTGLGTAVFTGGTLLPNTELGHIEIDGVDAEVKATDAARKREKMSLDEWAGHFDRYLCTLEKLLWPELIILGGGTAKKFAEFSALLNVRAKIVPARFLNEAGIVGAALAAAEAGPSSHAES
ncbi:MAG: polyphosphate--glucose phosphotransferase [Chloroflexota bacterium]